MDFSLVVARKLPFPHNPEAGFGAIAEDGSTFIIEGAKRLLPEETIAEVIEEQKKEIARRVAVLRQGRPLPEIAHKTVILVDDGIAMGSTMRAAIMLCRNKKAKKIVVAAPVTGRQVEKEMSELVDDIYYFGNPVLFSGRGSSLP